MTRKQGFALIELLAILAVLITAIGGVWTALTQRTHTKPPGPVACTMEAKECPDGSYVGRVGPSCEFAPCPTPKPAPVSLSCTKDADCPSSKYSCQAIEGTGVVYPNNTRPPEYTILKGECKLKEGNACRADAECLAGLVCHSGTCTNPVGSTCSGPNDAVCPKGYQCIQDCGPPVARIDEPPPGYHCIVDEVASKPRMCPICLASNTAIATPNGTINVKDVRVGMTVWSLDRHGRRIASKVIRVSHTSVPRTHRVVHLILSDGRQVWVSSNHPTSSGTPVGRLRVGMVYDGASVRSVDTIPYWDDATYDLLPDSGTGEYWANGILLGSTLKQE